MIFTAKRRNLALVCCVSLVALSAYAGLSFSVHLLNLAATVCALFSVGLLALPAFDIRPKFVGIVVGCCAFFLWLLLTLGLGAIALFEGNAALIVALGDGQYCEESVYGFVTGDSGEELTIYQRYLFIDHQVYRQIHSEIYPNAAPPNTARWRDAAARCQTKINETRGQIRHPDTN